VEVEIWSDVVCPWCAIGKVRFERALAGVDGGDQIAVRYRSFELDPTTPRVVEGAYVERLAAKYRTSTAQAQAMIDRMTAQAAAEGLTFDFAAARPGNTFDAHRLLHLAADRGVQRALKDRLLTAYLTEGAAIGTHEELRRLASDAGLDDTEVHDTLAGDAYADAVRADEQQARAYGITGVPFFVIDGRYGVSGAQPPEVLRQALTQAREATPDGDGDGRSAAAHRGHDPRACADGSCAIA
jgi:predicted DsbA family dithiol-disulfide isomerase